jgi:hypothetical protein
MNEQIVVGGRVLNGRGELAPPEFPALLEPLFLELEFFELEFLELAAELTTGALSATASTLMHNTHK